jgi:hypothetical protein
VKDWRGTPIAVGSTVVYPGRQSSYVWLNEATVLAVDEDARTLTIRRGFENARRSPARKRVDPSVKTLTALHMVTVVT